jgi:hypothetical protein
LVTALPAGVLPRLGRGFSPRLKRAAELFARTRKGIIMIIIAIIRPGPCKLADRVMRVMMMPFICPRKNKK